MRILLDTHLLIWATSRSSRLSKAVSDAVLDDGNEIFFSVASVWEVAIKAALRRSDFSLDADRFAGALPRSGFLELPIRTIHAVRVSRLPPLHGDPFDRLLVAQAIEEPLVLMTNDVVLGAYGPNVRVV